MALSSQWSQAVVVRATDAGEVIVPPQPNNGTARAMAAAGNPIIVRARTAENFGGGVFGGIDGRGVGDDHRTGTGRQGYLSSLLIGYDISQTFWVPDAAKGEMGLLEHLSRRGSTNRSYVLLQSRPLAELQANFSTCTGYNIDLGHNMFRLSKAAMALQHMDTTLVDGGEDYEDYGGNSADAAVTSGSNSNPYMSPTSPSQGSRRPGSQQSSQQLSISTRAFKASMRASLQSLQEEDYYLVKYRDYSAWAVSEYKSICKTDSMFGRKYVEQCFAVHVGREPGELIPMTEAQFLYGVDLLQRQLMNQLTNVPSRQPAGWGGADPNQSSYQQYQIDINYSALNADQFRSLGALLGDGMRQVGVEGEEKKREEQMKADARGRARGDDYYDYTPPAWYDWTPGAVRARVQHRLHGYYRSVGQLTVQVAVLGVCGFLLYRTVKDYLPGPSKNVDVLNDDRRRGGRGGGGRRRSRSYDDDYGYDYRPGLFRSILMGPKEVFDYLLAPSPEQ
ncbi:putative mitochondrial hypothetical protein [Leptomonas pyrrhocoris]|uniref:Uncharacterized protein n=1 Tax=Leptomonas pyrrhocoris TaxID=157538 RepID=A0A0M9FXE6_LEPPY|nr:putative mitochondrial hypothetical protein [Leptomonas pyrrhocoris]XP_015656381.1 putative mitochondrial hypothetical protein [Leptomonas pyrrhocoris]XP_015656382.1 putative mitochondrial hypothetical protein [Leptomonas pyrrhocoris]XP_015656383.1 putative mitochondrial hypothetical protein [Leptomonas pyrrhocoris]KPA77933.1 putative mitochondrial hypothetical protein [Leptomonas pyrrhocoris]KPA77942.1 putative mitochondrial hypothetical protein [Leptomonas pyrrhocoris]KPA77943.1 putative|eukprot:XP_015656372.1 putative mitochondrial hypothetical protein [Leptomonas pyrrhocoris]